MNEKKKVIFINGNKSNWYEQAIFIVKENNQNNIPKNLVLEAEKIINEYLSKKYYSSYNKPLKQPTNNNINSKNKKKLSSYNNMLNICIFCTIAIICYLLYQICI